MSMGNSTFGFTSSGPAAVIQGMVARLSPSICLGSAEHQSAVQVPRYPIIGVLDGPGPAPQGAGPSPDTAAEDAGLAARPLLTPMKAIKPGALMYLLPWVGQQVCRKECDAFPGH